MMPRLTLLLGCLTACDKEAPSLFPPLDGAWSGTVTTTETYDVSAVFVWDDKDEALSGTFAVDEPQGTRDFDLLEAISVQDFGVSLHFVETRGVRELYLDALTPLDPFEGAYRTTWFCEEEADLSCGESGGFALSPR